MSLMLAERDCCWFCGHRSLTYIAAQIIDSTIVQNGKILKLYIHTECIYTFMYVYDTYICVHAIQAYVQS